MVSKSIKKGIAILFGIAILSFSVTGCGGGGGDDSAPQGSSEIAESERVAITEENSEKITTATLDAIGEGFDLQNGPSFKSTASAINAPMLKIIEQPTFKKVLSSAQNLKTIAESGSYQCSEGGNISYNGSETSGTITYNNCQEAGSTINGTMSVSANSDGTSGTMTLTNFSMTSDGETIISLESMAYTYQFNANYELSNISITMNGYATSFGERTDFNNYKFGLTIDNNYNMTFTIDGFIKTACLGAWIEITTTEDIQISYADSCPTAGKITVGGNGSSLTIDFNANQSADVSINGGTPQHYSSCSELDVGTCNQ